MVEPTKTQTKVLAFIAARISEGLPPSLQEISHAFGWTTHAAAAHHIQALEKKGLVKRKPGIMRGISLIQDPLPEAA